MKRKIFALLSTFALIVTFVPSVYAKALPLIKPDPSASKAQPLKIVSPDNKAAKPAKIAPASTAEPTALDSVSPEQFEIYKEKLAQSPHYDKYRGYKLLYAGEGNVVSPDTPSNVFIIGLAKSGSPIFSKLTAVIFTAGHGDILFPFPKSLAIGAQPSFELVDMTDDKLADIVLTLPTGGSGGEINCLILTCKNDKAYVVYPHRKVPMFFKGRFLPNYKALLFVNNVIKQEIDLSHKKSNYESQGHYRNGRLAFADTPWAYLTEIKPFQNNAGFYSLECIYTVKGFHNADTIASMRAIIVYSPSRKAWQFRTASISPVK